jgi:uncharacterized membrane protein YphA (DoxX/SURF4 family)
MEIGIDSFAAFLPESKHQAFVPASQRMADLLAEVETADRGGLAIIVGWQTRWVALALAGFSVLSALIFHNNFADQNEMANFMKNIAIAGGFLFLFANGAGARSLDNRKAV